MIIDNKIMHISTYVGQQGKICDQLQINKIGRGPESLGFIACIGVVYSQMHHLVCKFSSKQECQEL